MKTYSIVDLEFECFDRLSNDFTCVCAIEVDEFAVFSPPTDSQWRCACCVTRQRHRTLLSHRHVRTAQSVVDTRRNYFENEFIFNCISDDWTNETEIEK